MKLPNADKAIVERAKVADYLLNAAHPDNSGKAEFFIRLGFRREQWEILAAALKALAVESEVTAAADSPHGKKHVLTGRIQSPTGNTPMVQSVWIVDKGLDAARLVTAYPRKA
jgi:hypothetical protein